LLNRKKGGLNGLLSKLNKPQKINTLEKSKLDWEKFKDEDDLMKHDVEKQKKNGYLERQAFLQRTDNNILENIKKKQKF